MTAYTRHPTTVSLAQAAIRWGCSHHTGLRAAGGVLPRQPGAPGLGWACYAGSLSTSVYASDRRGWPGRSTLAPLQRGAGLRGARPGESGPPPGGPRPAAAGRAAAALGGADGFPMRVEPLRAPGARWAAPPSLAAAAGQAHQRAATRWRGAATRAAAGAGAAADAGAAGGAHWLAWTPSNRLAATSRRPSASSTGTRRTTRGPCQQRGGSCRGRPGCASPQGQRPCCWPHTSPSWRPAHVRGPNGRRPPLRQAHPQRAFPRGLPVGPNAADPVEAQGDTGLKRSGGRGTVPGMASAPAQAQREPVPAHAETQDEAGRALRPGGAPPPRALINS